jgi:hypothetical protein
MKQFLFMYPIDTYFDIESDEHKACVSTRKYFRIFNNCINERYRSRGFGINFAVFDDKEVDKRIKVVEGDRIIKVGITSHDHFDDEEYPDFDFILNQLNLKDIKHFRVAGFHLWDCVERIAKRAYERGIDVLVDEDLTNMFASRVTHPNFRTDKYPTFELKNAPTLDREWFIKAFLEARMDKPWMFQDYER